MSKNDLTIDHFYSSYIDKIDKQEKKITENITKYEKNGDSTKLHEEKTKMMKIKKKNKNTS